MMLKLLQDLLASAPAFVGRLSPVGSMRAMAGSALVAGAWGCVMHSPAAANPTEQVLWSFGNGTDGQEPYAGLLDVLGTLYGTTSAGGTYHNGTLFSLTLGTNSENVLWSFGNGKDANQPYGNVISVNGELYGATTGGGNDDVGTVFSFDPQGNAETVLHSFDVSNGQTPYSLVKVRDKLYGTTPWGGPGTGYNGTVYSYDLKTGRTKVLYYFGNAPDSSHPYGALVNVNGTLYGTAYAGGTNGLGTVFSFNPQTHAEQVLYSFGNGTDGQSPSAGMIDVKGMLYGTTYSGGAYGYGTVYAFNPQTNAESVLWSFGSGTDGQNPNRSLTSVKGMLYGTTVFGGTHNDGGTVFSLNPQTKSETVLWSFGNGADGLDPESNLINVTGTLYGTTLFGGKYGDGTVFSIVP